MAKLGERMITIDCDVIGADGGTRTASITGAWVALSLALRKQFDPADAKTWPLTGQIAAVSVGIVDGTPVLDLPYAEDSTAEVDMNVAMTAAGGFVELQGTAEGKPFDRGQLDILLALADSGIRRLFDVQRDALACPCLTRRFATGRASRVPHHDRAMLRAQRTFEAALAPANRRRERRAYLAAGARTSPASRTTRSAS